MALTHSWNSSFESTPADTDDASEGALRMRNIKEAVRERLQADHYMELGGTNADHGKHQVVTFVDNGADPPNPSSNQRVIWNNAGTTKIKDDSGNESVIGGFPSGTKMPFYQASAPVGWTQDTTVNDAVIRIVSGSGGSTGGTNGIASISTEGHALTLAESAPHDHGGGDHRHGYTNSNDTNYGHNAMNSDRGNQTDYTNYSGNIINSEGGGEAHSHNIDPKYADFIIATKD